MNRFASHPAYLNGIPQTGQTTSYVTGDAGTFQSGVPHRYELLTAGQYSGTVAIVLNGKTDTHSNAVVIDHQNKLMWSQTLSGGVGPASNGILPWTTNAGGEGVFTFVAAANAALLSGYGNDADPLYNWRMPNDNELVTLRNMQPPTGSPDATYFTSAFTNIWSSTSRADASSNAMVVSMAAGHTPFVVKTDAVTGRVLLVRSV